MSEKSKTIQLLPGARAAAAQRKYTNAKGITTPQSSQTRAARLAQTAAWAATHPPLPIAGRNTGYVTGGKSKSKSKNKSKSKPKK